MDTLDIGQLRHAGSVAVMLTMLLLDLTDGEFAVRLRVSSLGLSGPIRKEAEARGRKYVLVYG